MLFNFFKYLYDLDNDGIANYLNCYSTFLMTKKDLCNNILYHRMNVLINYYISNTIPPPRKYDLVNYYLSIWKDDYLNKPTINYQIPFKDSSWDNMDEDVRDHYHFMTSRPPPKEEIDYDEYDKKFYQEEEDKKLEELNKKMKEYDDTYEDDWDCDDWGEYDNDYEIDYDVDYYEYK
jgi:hypothetical protein